MKSAIQTLLDKALQGDASAYTEFKTTHRLLPLEEAEEVLAYLPTSKIDTSNDSVDLTQMLLDLGSLADRATQHYDKRRLTEKARSYAKQSCTYWEKAIADYNSAEAHYQLGRWYLRNWSLFTVNVQKGLKHIEIAAEQHQHGEALYYLAKVHDLGKYPDQVKNPQKAINYWQAANIHANHAGAAFCLAKLYEAGYENIIASDMKKAFELLTRAAELGHPQAAFSLWVTHKEGTSANKLTVPKNSQEAQRWLTRAAQAGDLMGQYVLGKAYLTQGKNLEEKQQGLTLLQASARQGNKDAIVLVENINLLLTEENIRSYTEERISNEDSKSIEERRTTSFSP